MDHIAFQLSSTYRRAWTTMAGTGGLMRIHRAGIATAALLMVAVQAWGAPLTLQECLRKAGENNPALKSSAWDARIARDNIRQASAAYLPRIDAQGGYTMQLEPQAVIINSREVETQEPDFAFAGLAASYTIYDFGRREARKLQAGANADAAVQHFEAKRSDIALQTIEAYFGILESGKLVQAAQDEVTQVEEHRRVAQVLFEEGVVTRNDVLQADVRLAAARQKLLALRNRRENAWLQLNFLTGSQPGFRSDLDDTAAVDGDRQPGRGSSLDLSRRHDIQALRYSLDAGEHEVTESRSNFLPELYTRLALDYVQNDKVREQTIMSATLGIRVNLFDGYATSTARDKAVKNRSRLQATLRLAEQQARLEADTAANDKAVAQERIIVAEVAIRQSEENLRINRERYRERVGTATEVLDAQTLVTQARTDFYRAFYDHQTATARLKRALGVLTKEQPGD
jgi:outer membrane protein TolC